MWETILGAVSSVIPNVIADLMKSIFHMFRKKRDVIADDILRRKNKWLIKTKGSL